jgi:hypothetical protein
MSHRNSKKVFFFHIPPHPRAQMKKHKMRVNNNKYLMNHQNKMDFACFLSLLHGIS